MVAVGGSRPPEGMIFSYGNLEHTLLSVRTQMLESQEIRTRQAYISVARNYGDINSEMQMERDSVVTTPNSGTNYTLRSGTPMFIESMRADSVKYMGLVSNNGASTTTSFFMPPSPGAVPNPFQVPNHVGQLYAGQIVEVNGEQRTVQSVNLATGQVNLAAPPLAAAPPIGTPVLVRGRDFYNPHLTSVHRVTDKYRSHIIDEHRYQVDRTSGVIRYRPMAGTLANSIWHPEAQTNKPYYFGRAIPIRQVPPPAGPGPASGVDDGIPNNEQLGEPDDIPATGLSSDPANAAFNATTLTSFGRAYPDGEFTNIIITAPAGVSVEVEINGGKVAIDSSGGTINIPFFDPDHTNDNIKANDGIDPDLYIQRFLKVGLNHISIKAIETAGAPGNAAGQNGIRVQGIFNGVDLDTSASATSVNTTDWSTSQHSILGIAGKVDFDLGDRVALEDVNDEVQKGLGVLESLTTIIASTDVNALNSLLSVIR